MHITLARTARNTTQHRCASHISRTLRRHTCGTCAETPAGHAAWPHAGWLCRSSVISGADDADCVVSWCGVCAASACALLLSSCDDNSWRRRCAARRPCLPPSLSAVNISAYCCMRCWQPGIKMQRRQNPSCVTHFEPTLFTFCILLCCLQTCSVRMMRVLPTSITLTQVVASWQPIHPRPQLREFLDMCSWSSRLTLDGTNPNTQQMKHAGLPGER